MRYALLLLLVGAVWIERANPDGSRRRVRIGGKVSEVQFEHEPVRPGGVPGVVSVWVDGDRVFVHSGNGHELRPRWRSSNFLEITLSDED